MSWALAFVVGWMVGAAPGIGQALALEEAGQDAQALAALDALVVEQPAWELPRLEATRLRLKLGVEVDRAELDAEVARALAPENPRAQYLWGLVREERGDPDGAQRAFELALEFRPSYDEARFRLAGLYFDRQQWEQAEAQYRELVRRRPDWTQARLQLIESMDRQGRTPAVEEELQRLWAEGSKLAGRRLADLYERTGRPEQAQKLRAQLDPPPKKMRPLKKSRR